MMKDDFNFSIGTNDWDGIKNGTVIHL